MENKEIVSLLAHSGIVETICRNLGGEDEDLKDLSQDIYISLLEKDNDLLNELMETGTYRYYIAKMAINNIFSKTSPYYEDYKRFKRMNDEGYLQDNGEVSAD